MNISLLYQNYRSYFSALERKSPVAFGLNHEEYKEALLNPAFFSIEIEGGSKNKSIFPLLCPIENWPWMSREYFQANFPNEKNYYLSVPSNLNDGQLSLYLEKAQTYIEELKKQHKSLRITIETGGFEDFPLQHSALKAILKKLEKGEKDISQHGLQKFFCGKFEASNSGTFGNHHQVLASSSLRSHDGPVLFSTPSLELSRELWLKYQNVMGYLNRYNPAQETLDKQEFYHLVEDTKSAIFAYVSGGKISSLCIMSPEFDQFNWLNPQFYKTTYPSFMENSNLYVFPLIFTDPSMRGLNHAKKMLQYIALTLARHGATIVFAFDCNKRASKIIPRLIQRSVNSSKFGTVALETVGKQEYLSFLV